MRFSFLTLSEVYDDLYPFRFQIEHKMQFPRALSLFYCAQLKSIASFNLEISFRIEYNTDDQTMKSREGGWAESLTIQDQQFCSRKYFDAMICRPGRLSPTFLSFLAWRLIYFRLLIPSHKSTFRWVRLFCNIGWRLFPREGKIEKRGKKVLMDLKS